jgi:RraA family protein
LRAPIAEVVRAAGGLFIADEVNLGSAARGLRCGDTQRHGSILGRARPLCDSLGGLAWLGLINLAIDMNKQQINEASVPIPVNLADELRTLAVAHLSDNLQRLEGICGLQRMHRSAKLVGTALTVKTRPGDNLLVYKALTMVSPGHVLVVDGAGDVTNAIVGELLMLYAIERGCAGFVIDGAVRDSAAFRTADFPCYARAISHRGPYKTGPGSVNVPVAMCGQVVNPGDVLVGDEDGLVSFPASAAHELIAAARASQFHEDQIRAEILNGRVDQSWIRKALDPHDL